jgi:phosphatidate phosphatase APP1
LDDNGFPFGSLDETKLVFTDISTLLKLSETLAYKVERISTIMSRFPRRKFVFVGDSTQKDPEAYAAVYNPEQTACIWIRLVEGVNPDKETTLNAAVRFEATFANIPKSKWFVFRDPAELWELNPAAGECRPASSIVSQL